MYKILIVLLLTASCGKTKSPQDEEFVQKFSLQQHGYYRAPLKILNPGLSKGLSGRGSFFINDFQFYAKINLKTPWKGVTHMQIIHAGSECPTMKDDLNKDGYLDGVEAMNVAGKVLIPLDYDLEIQFGTFSIYPVSDDNGKYLYSQSNSSGAMMRDLWSRDRNPLDYIIKVRPGEEINFYEKVVIVYGVPEQQSLPDTVVGFESYADYFSLPVACGKLSETSDTF